MRLTKSEREICIGQRIDSYPSDLWRWFERNTLVNLQIIPSAFIHLKQLLASLKQKWISSGALQMSSTPYPLLLASPQSLLTPLCFPSSPHHFPVPNRSPSAEQAAMHKYINLGTASLFVGGCVNVGIEMAGRHSQTSFMCHRITGAQCLHTRPIQTLSAPHTPAMCRGIRHPVCGGLGTKAESTWRWWCQTASLIWPTATELMWDTTGGRRSNELWREVSCPLLIFQPSFSQHTPDSVCLLYKHHGL